MPTPQDNKPLDRIPFHQIIGQGLMPTAQEEMTFVGWDALPVLAIALQEV